MSMERLVTLLFIVAIPIALWFNMQREKKLLSLAWEKWAMVHRIDRLLTVWAEHWGEAPDVMRSLLKDAMAVKDQPK